MLLVWETRAFNWIRAFSMIRSNFRPKPIFAHLPPPWKLFPPVAGGGTVASCFAVSRCGPLLVLEVKMITFRVKCPNFPLCKVVSFSRGDLASIVGSWQIHSYRKRFGNFLINHDKDLTEIVISAGNEGAPYRWFSLCPYISSGNIWR